MTQTQINRLASDYSQNLETLFNAGQGRIGTKNGRLYLTAPSEKQSGSYFARLFGSSNHELAQIVNQTCQRFFNEIILKNSGPLLSSSASLAAERSKVSKLISNINRLGTDLLAQPLKEDLEELATSPETLEARLALRMGIQPKILNEGISGTYIMLNRLKKPWGIFKPKVQEVGGNKNPSWVVWAFESAEKWGIESGTGYLRETAAYQLDKDHFAEVPFTTCTHYSHAKLDTSLFCIGNPPDLVGSFQSFKEHCKPASEVVRTYEQLVVDNNRKFLRILTAVARRIYLMAMRAIFFCGLRHIPAHEIHKMGILDIRLLNCDRHARNFLINRQSKLYPIDHGLILPKNANSLRYEWKHLIQTHFPFSSATLQYIEKLDPEKDALILKQCGITSESSIERMKLSTHLLKACAAKKMTLYQIADLMLGKKQARSRSRNTYFENEICRKVLKEKQDADLVIRNAIGNYLYRT